MTKYFNDRIENVSEWVLYSITKKQKKRKRGGLSLKENEGVNLFLLYLKTLVYEFTTSFRFWRLVLSITYGRNWHWTNTIL